MTARIAPALFTGKPDRPVRRDGRGPGRPSRETIERRNEELLDHALDLFLENGFEATTIETICQAVGMSRRTIYARYGDKETLFKAALQTAIQRWLLPVERLQQAEVDSLEDTLVGIARLWVANVRTPTGWRLVRIASSEALRRPEVAAWFHEQAASATIGYLTDLFRRRLRPGADSVPDAVDAAAAFIILVVEGSVQLAIWGPADDAEFDRQIRYRVGLFLNGALAAPGG